MPDVGHRSYLRTAALKIHLSPVIEYDDVADDDTRMPRNRWAWHNNRATARRLLRVVQRTTEIMIMISEDEAWQTTRITLAVRSNEVA